MIDVTKIPKIKIDPLRFCLLNKLISQKGLWLEFGTWKGQTIDLISQYTDNKVYGFDTFSGLDIEWSGTPTGSMKCFDIGGVPPVSVLPVNPYIRYGPPVETRRVFKENVRFICGLFHETLPKFMKIHKENISFLHIDCDIYHSTKTIFRYCGKSLSKGSIIVFDELMNYDGYEEHELKAFSEFVFENSTFKFEWIGMKDCSVACRVL